MFGVHKEVCNMSKEEWKIDGEWLQQQMCDLKQLLVGKHKWDCIVGVERGGAFFGRYLSVVLRIQYHGITVSSYSDRIRGSRLEVTSFLDTLESIKGKRVLLVDDIFDSGNTMAVSLGLLQLHAQDVTGFVFVTKDQILCNKLDICFWNVVGKDTWVVFPWECPLYTDKRL